MTRNKTPRTRRCVAHVLRLPLNAERRAQASPAALATLCGAVETAVTENVGVSTPTVDVFVRENLFPDAISASQERLALAARTEDGLVAWGNTNTQVCVPMCTCVCVCAHERGRERERRVFRRECFRRCRRFFPGTKGTRRGKVAMHDCRP